MNLWIKIAIALVAIVIPFMMILFMGPWIMSWKLEINPVLAGMTIVILGWLAGFANEKNVLMVTALAAYLCALNFIFSNLRVVEASDTTMILIYLGSFFKIAIVLGLSTVPYYGGYYLGKLFN